MNDIEELLELEGCTPREDRNQFLGNQVWNSTGECIFLKDSHRLTMIARICLYAAQFSLKRAGAERVEMTHLKVVRNYGKFWRFRTCGAASNIGYRNHNYVTPRRRVSLVPRLTQLVIPAGFD